MGEFDEPACDRDTRSSRPAVARVGGGCGGRQSRSILAEPARLRLPATADPRGAPAAPAHGSASACPPRERLLPGSSGGPYPSCCRTCQPFRALPTLDGRDKAALRQSRSQGKRPCSRPVTSTEVTVPRPQGKSTCEYPSSHRIPLPESPQSSQVRLKPWAAPAAPSTYSRKHTPPLRNSLEFRYSATTLLLCCCQPPLSGQDRNPVRSKAASPGETMEESWTQHLSLPGLDNSSTGFSREALACHSAASRPGRSHAGGRIQSTWSNC